MPCIMTIILINWSVIPSDNDAVIRKIEPGAQIVLKIMFSWTNIYSMNTAYFTWGHVIVGII